MNRKMIKATAYVISAVVALSGMSITADAAGTDSVLPSGGIGLKITRGTSLENVTDQTAIPVESIIEWINIVESDVALASTLEEPTEEELFRNLVIAQVNDYVNVRSIPSEEGDIIGKLYKNSVGTFEAEEDGWYKITSGSVTGYVKAEYCVTGEDAVEIAKQVGKRIATVNTQTLFVRAEATTESSVIGMVPEADELLVLEAEEGWVKVDVEEGTGWVSTDYVELHSEFVQAESKEDLSSKGKSAEKS